MEIVLIYSILLTLHIEMMMDTKNSDNISRMEEKGYKKIVGETHLVSEKYDIIGNNRATRSKSVERFLENKGK